MAFYDNNYQYYQPHTYYDPHESRYVQNDSYHTQYNNNSYQLSPSEPLIGYYYSTYNNDSLDDILTSKNNANFNENGEYFYDPVSTQFVISYSNLGTEVNELDYSEYNPEPYNGGYDIDATYGKALPASDDICYPPSTIKQKLKVEAKPVTNEAEDEDEEEEDEDFSDDGKEDIVQSTKGEPILTNGIVAISKVTQEEDSLRVDEDEDEDEDEPKLTNENVVSQVTQEENSLGVEQDEDEDEDEDGDGDEDEEEEGIDSGVEEDEEKEEENRGNGTEIRRQIPAGYGMEAIDICDGLFGGYFPCLLKRNESTNCDQCGGEVKLKRDDYYDNWQGTVDYLFGNPNPYGGSMPEKGSYGDPVYCYHRHYPQESITGHGQVLFRENNSWVDSSRYY